ncbi:MAG: archaeosine biosynthesis radical SAM protein RaSEA [Candidatus Methanomethylophilaceae archaeon]|nr:archaeosine biosynthesis radical SAM protein RaSEA [Candidatus Methanomethylophilaceae archaeon]
MKERRPDELETLWKEKDVVNGKLSDAMVAIMRTNGCVWAKNCGGCTMCGYRTASLHDVTEDDLMKQVDQMLSRYKGESFVKLYTSGSFLDENEIPMTVRERIFDEFSSCDRILFESRPEFIEKDVLSTLPKSTTIALGLESSDPEVMEVSIRKGFTPDDAKRAGELAKDAGLMVRSYLLLKPLYMQERVAIDSAIDSARFADPFSDEISINPVNVQKGTVVERIWKRGDYRPPWIWSLIEVFKELSGTINSRLMSSPSGGGSQRGVHNCGECDQRALEAIERFSFTQDVNDLNVTCECRDSWQKYMLSESMLGTAADLDRGFSSDLMIRK